MIYIYFSSKFVRKFNLFASCIITSAPSAFAQGTPLDQYKQMGGVAAIAEACFGSKAIPEKLNLLIKRTVAQNPSTTDTMKSLISEYNIAYKKAVLDRQLWNGTSAKFSSSFNCEIEKDKSMIRNIETSIISNLK